MGSDVTGHKHECIQLLTCKYKMYSGISTCFKLFISYLYEIHSNLLLTVDASHSFRVLSSEADTMYLDPCDQAMSEIPCLCPVMVLSSFPSNAPQILTVLSAATK